MRTPIQSSAASKWCEERGAELVEFAFALPLLLVVFGGLVDFGFIFQRYGAVINAAREGARLSTQPGVTNADVETRVDDYLNAGLGSGAADRATVGVAPVSITPAGGTAYQATRVTVSLAENYMVLGPLISLVGGNAANFGAITLTSVVTVRSGTPGL